MIGDLRSYYFISLFLTYFTAVQHASFCEHSLAMSTFSLSDPSQFTGDSVLGTLLQLNKQTRYDYNVTHSPKSATVPVYSAECSPAAIRGALVMMCKWARAHP